MSGSRKARRIHPLVAAGLFVAALLVAGSSLHGVWSGPAHEEAGVDEPFDPELEAAPDAGRPAIEWRDLLAAHGSYAGGPVRCAFTVPDAGLGAMPAPAGEIAAGLQWDGPDPPELRLGVVMVSERSRRAVLAGRVVGIADRIGGGVVQRIARDGVVLLWNSRSLTYDLEDGWPREFRSEAARRQHLAAAAAAANEGGGEGGGGEPPDETNRQEKRE